VKRASVDKVSLLAKALIVAGPADKPGVNTTLAIPSASVFWVYDSEVL
jgi:hypothetical protein